MNDYNNYYANNGMSMNDSQSRPYDDNYMQQEEEWEREGLLDPLWEKQQKKVFSFF
jgi:hypothetical protein